MVHPGLTAITLDEILGNLLRGNVVTHVYHGRSQGVLDEDGRVLPIGSRGHRSRRQF